MKEAINERVGHRERLQAIADVELPPKITSKEVERLASEVRQIAESRDPDQKRTGVRQYIAALEAEPEQRTVRVLVNHPSSFLSTFPGSARGSRTPATSLKETCPNR